MLQNRLFFALASRSTSRFWSCNFDAVARISIVFCNSVSADRIVMAASRLLGAAAAYVILVSFAAGHRKSYWSRCIKAAIMNCQQILLILALVIFLFKIFRKCLKIVFFFAFSSRSGFAAAISDAVACIVLLRLATPSLQTAL